MTMRWTAVLLFLLTFPPFAAAQESVVTGLSTNTIALNSTFDGSELFVFGAIRRDSPTLPGAKPLDIIITIKGPERPVTVRRKERWFGIWVNAESVRVRAVPSVYAIASTRPLSDLLTETEQLRYQRHRTLCRSGCPAPSRQRSLHDCRGWRVARRGHLVPGPLQSSRQSH
jgi:uncharacterized protein (TIGR02186 family)